MAKFEAKLQGTLSEISSVIDNEILSGSVSATLEDESHFSSEGCSCTTKVYERYSYIGQNRVSLTVTLFETAGSGLYISAITSGGSQAVFFKLNTFGEEAFLDKLEEVLEKYIVSTTGRV